MSTNRTNLVFLQLGGCAGVEFVASSAGAVMSQNMVDKSAQTSTDKPSSSETPMLKTIEFETVTLDAMRQITKE